MTEARRQSCRPADDLSVGRSYGGNIFWPVGGGWKKARQRYRAVPAAKVGATPTAKVRRRERNEMAQVEDAQSAVEKMDLVCVEHEHPFRYEEDGLVLPAERLVGAGVPPGLRRAHVFRWRQDRQSGRRPRESFQSGTLVRSLPWRSKRWSTTRTACCTL